MQRDSKAAIALEIERYWAEARYGHAAAVVEVLERLPNGEYAWLRPEPAKAVVDSNPAESDDALYVPTDAGHDLVVRMRAQEALFGHPWPTVAEAG